MISKLSQPKYFLLFVGLLTFLLQPYKVGFEKGHHGWVSSHTLAIITRATPENFFLGYTRDEVTNAGVDKVYFDRYPVLFAGTFHLLLSPFWDRLDVYTYLSRQLMNVIFIITGLLLLRLLKKLASEEVALGATFFTLSSAYLVKYKDMVHFDQPALVGCLLALNGVVDFEKEGKTKFLYWGSLFGTLLGRGYAVIFIFAAWLIVRSLKDFSPAKTLQNKALFFFLISIPLPTLMLGMNIVSEARIRNVSISETSIVVSAKHRFGLQKYKEGKAAEKQFRWGSFVSNQIQRALDLTTPYVFYGVHVKNYKEKLKHYLSLIPKLFFQIFLLFLILRHGKLYWRSLSSENKRIFQTFALSGVMWILLMRNLANYHDYVSMYLIGFLAFIAIFLMDHFSKAKPILIRCMPAVFILSLGFNFFREQLTAREVNWQSEEFQKVRTQMEAKERRVAYVGNDFYSFLDGVPHASDFMLSGFLLTENRVLGNISIVKDKNNFRLENIE